jgi:hypothetical protein
MDKLIGDFPYLKNKIPYNKIGQGVGTTRMEETFMPCEYGMDVTSH